MDKHDFFVNADLSILFYKIIFSIQELEISIQKPAREKYNNNLSITTCVKKFNHIIPENKKT